jgi:hypothetical protein
MILKHLDTKPEDLFFQPPYLNSLEVFPITGLLKAVLQHPTILREWIGGIDPLFEAKV